MAQAKAAVDVRDFTGIQLQDDGQDMEAGKAKDQVNLRSDVQTMARVRPGFALVSFDLISS